MRETLLENVKRMVKMIETHREKVLLVSPLYKSLSFENQKIFEGMLSNAFAEGFRVGSEEMEKKMRHKITYWEGK